MKPFLLRSAVVYFFICATLATFTSTEATNAQNREEEVFNLARGYFHTAIFSPDGKRLLTASGSSSTGITPVAQLWDVESGKLLRTFRGHDATIHSISFDLDGQRIITGAGNNYYVGLHDPTARVWDTATGEQLLVLKPDTTYVVAARFLANENRILTVTNRQSGQLEKTAIVWDAKTQRKLLVLSELSFYSRPMKLFEPPQLSPSRNRIAGLESDGHTLKVWNVENGEVLWRTDSKHLGADSDDQIGFGAIRFSPDEKLLLAAGSDNVARIWDVGIGRELQKLEGHERDIRATSFCFDGNRVVTAARDGTARLWDVDTGREICRFDHPGPVMEMSVGGDDDTRMITEWRDRDKDSPNRPARKFGSLWDLTTGREIKRLEFETGHRYSIIFSPDGQKLLANLGKGNVVLLKAQTGEVIRRFE